MVLCLGSRVWGLGFDWGVRGSGNSELRGSRASPCISGLKSTN